MGEIISILMRRDHLSRKEAVRLIEETREEIENALMRGDCTHDEVEQIIADYLGLEPDYLIYLLP